MKHIFLYRTIWNLYKDTLIDKNFLSVKIFQASEARKNLQEVSSYIQFLLKHNIHKNQVLVVVGGALVQDIGSFTAHVILRGIDWVHIPTTLLAMADSCIGSKSGLNVGKYKNQVGAFYPQKEIYISTEFLKTLPEAEYVNGIGEILKHAIIKGGESFDYLSENITNINNKKTAEMIIYKSLFIKKEIIEEDELEHDLRKVLNYGHTFGHALEGYTKNRIAHGGAVIMGMDIANFISMNRGLLAEREYVKIHKILNKYLPQNIHVENVRQYMKFLEKDKKATRNGVSAILCKGIGKIEIIKLQFDKGLLEILTQYFKQIKQ